MNWLAKFTSLFFAVVAIILSDVSAQEKPVGGGFVDEFHGDISQRLTDFVGGVDGFFGDDEAFERVNESWARIRLDTLKREGDNIEHKANLKLKLVLPSTEKRLRILVSSEEDDSRNPNDDQSAIPSSPTDDGNLSLALRFLRTVRKNSSLKFDVGAKFRDRKVQGLFRISGFVRYDLDENWWWSVSDSATYFTSAGFENALTFKFERYIDRDDSVLLLSSTQFNWAAELKGAIIGQTVGLYQELDEKRSIALEGLTGVLTSPPDNDHRYQGTELRVRFRHNVWRDWFYYEVWPSVSWPQDRDYKAVYGGLIRVEAIIGKHR